MFKFIGTAIAVAAVCLIAIAEPADAQIFRRRAGIGPIFRPAASVSSCNSPVCHQPIEVVHNAVAAPVAVPVPYPVAVFQYLGPTTITQPTQPIMQIPEANTGTDLPPYGITEPYSGLSPDMPPDLIVDDNSPEPGPVNHREWLSAMQNNCAKCHNVTKKSGGVILFDRNNNFTPNVTLEKIREAIAVGGMPKNRNIPADLRVFLIRGTEKR